MTTLELRTQLKDLIDKEQDVSLLQYVLRFLNGDDDEALWKVKLGQRADHAEDDFKSGRTFTEEQVKDRLSGRTK